MVAVDPTYLCISDPAVLMPRHNNRITPVRATPSRNLVLVTKLHTALEGGSWALAAFQLKPPLGRSIVTTSWGGPQHHPYMCGCGRSTKARGGLRWASWAVAPWGFLSPEVFTASQLGRAVPGGR